MKRTALVLLSLAFSAAHAARADTEPLAGAWRGTFSSPSGKSVIELRFDSQTGKYVGHYWVTNPYDTTFTVNEPVGPGQSVRFVVPNVGTFEGHLHGDVLEGTFTGGSGSNGGFQLDRAPEPDFLGVTG